MNPATSGNRASGWASVDKVTFGVAGGLIVALCVLGMVFTETLTGVSAAALTWMTGSFSWLFVLSASGFVIFALVLAFGKYGSIPLSQEGEEPEFATATWVAMMFAAGMAIGLVFFGVFEPISHYTEPPPFGNVEAETPDAAGNAMAYTFFHYGVHPWAIYSVVGLALAYSTHRMGRANLISAPFEALIPHLIKRGWGKVVDIFAIIATQFGLATSLGFGALQIAAGLALLQTGEFEDEPGVVAPILVICALTFLAVVSAATGITRGIKWLSNINMVIAAILLVFVFVVGPSIFILDLLPTAIGSYFSEIISMSSNSGLFGGTEWLASFTIFYWAWWISWAPYVGTFIAKISRGRTIREFVGGALLTPTAVGMVWFTVFGGTGISLQDSGVDVAGTGDEAAAFFVALEQLPLSTVAVIVTIILVAIFFVTGADSGAVVMGTFATGGSERPWKPLVVFWAAASGAVAAMLMLVGGLDALQTFAILAAAPFVLIMIGLCVAMYVDLRRDPLRKRAREPVRGATHTASAVPFSDEAEETSDADEAHSIRPNNGSE